MKVLLPTLLQYIGVSVWTFKESDGRWLWLLRPAPENSLPIPDSRSWNIAGKEIVSLPPKYAIYSYAFHFSWQCALENYNSSFSARMIEIASVFESNVFCTANSLLQLFRLLLRPAADYVYSWKMDLQTGLWRRYVDRPTLVTFAHLLRYGRGKVLSCTV